uniref:GH16 domain-containing protein n=1 Tax=Phytophthora ramorum TaxID=164328 RepID=H3GIQ7_PHYRM
MHSGLVLAATFAPWVDSDTPESAYTITSSRGATWDLVMSDEFNVPGRNFSAGRDHMWTALEMPDGVNSALEYYSINMTNTVTDSDGRGVFQIKIMEEENITYTVWNTYATPPGFETHNMYYRAGMTQSWNKFCFQGGRMEASAKLPATTSSSNPDVGNAKGRVKTSGFYPTWPGIWLLGNLGRALFSQTTSRMWPWSYNECNEDLKDFQRISACDGSPGHGLNPHQGRGAPEIDLLEGGGIAISSSIQLAPGMPDKFRIIPPTGDDSPYCVYAATCTTIGANFPGIPAKTYEARGFESWYQGLRYAPNPLCASVGDLIQDPKTVIANMKQGITSNTCKGVNTCPASGDGNLDIDLIDGNGTRYWGVNDDGGCMPIINGYMGAFLCDPDSSNKKCSAPLGAEQPKKDIMAPFEYQMDAISANWPVQLAAYTDYLKYQVEWVMGPEGYIRWMLDDNVIFEIPSEAVENVPQDDAKSNPKKIMLEEPMYIIFNVALSTSWGTVPPNPGSPCRGDGTNTETNAICDGFPMYMNIDYIRVYQDLSSSSTMAIGCNPSTHPTKQWIEDHIDEYETEENKWIEVHGGANCRDDNDCTVGTSHITTGSCSKKGHCTCGSSGSWGGPRCTTALADTANGEGFGPPVVVSILFAVFIIVVFAFVIYKIMGQRNKKAMVIGAGVTGPAILSKVELDDIPRSNGSDDKLV